jgi:glyoxylase I family protein
MSNESQTGGSPLSTSAHHVSISVRSLSATLEFYRFAGYEELVRWEAPDGSLSIVHLAPGDGCLLEVFAYAKNADRPGPASHDALPVGNDLEAVGVKHFALRVADVGEAHTRMSARWSGRTTPVQHGRTGIDYFFVADPDGLWVEIVQDDRELALRRVAINRREQSGGADRDS